ncbi:uncharacterized protein [Macrobrachium rosenbergii]|uniref:uncharacterized protein isoform X1 n=1 Tax=Macrobrachium rosenbergii TaxID=79674 RepID=UPI0034D47D81
MVTSVIAVVVSSLLIRSALSAETGWGRCPVPPAMYGFEMSKFEGLWYLQETFDPGERCATWNVTKGRESNTWKVVESKESGAFSAMGFRHADFHTGTITMMDAKNQGDLRVFWPISALGGLIPDCIRHRLRQLRWSV